jgi:hypothetical protein
VRQILPIVVLPQTLAFALVPALRIRQHVPCCQLQYCVGLPAHLRLHAFAEKLGRHGHRRELRQSNAALHGDRCAEHGYGYPVACTAYSHGSESTDAKGAKTGSDLHFWRRLRVSTISR